MEKQIQYENQLNDLLFETSAEKLISRIAIRKSLAILVAFKNSDSVFPCLSIGEKEKVFDYLVEDEPLSSLPFICSFNMRGIELCLPCPTGFQYRYLKEIEIDELNLRRILTLIRENSFPVLESLTIYTEGDLVLAIEHLKKLKILKLYNLSNQLRNLPDLNGLRLDQLSLSGYILEFQSSLPRVLYLEQCLIIRSQGLNGCEEMTLFHSRWDSPSFPSKKLVIESGSLQFSSRLPPTLSHLSLMNSEVDQLNLARLSQLTYLRLLGCKSESRIELPPSLETLIVSVDFFSRFGGRLVESVRHFYLQSTQELDLDYKQLFATCSNHLNTFELLGANLNLSELFSSLPQSVRELTLTSCSTEETGLIQSDVFPNSLQVLQFFQCEFNSSETKTSKRLEISLPTHLKEFTAIGKISANQSSISGLPVVRGQVENEILCGTNVFKMQLVEFKLFCISKLINGVFKEYEDYYRDLLEGSRTISDQLRSQYLAILLELPFEIPAPSSKRVLEEVINKANPNLLLRINRHSYSIEKIRGMVRARNMTSDKDLQSILTSFLT